MQTLACRVPRIRSLATNSLGHVFAGTEAGLYLSTNDGVNWTHLDSGLTDNDVLSLAVSSSGYIFVGTDGYIFRSLNPTEGAAESAALIRANRFQDAIRSLKRYFVDQGLDQLGYTDEFLHCIMSLLNKNKSDSAIRILNVLGGMDLKDRSRVKFNSVMSLLKWVCGTGDRHTSKSVSKLSDPRNPTAQLLLCKAYYNTGRYDDVIRILGSTPDKKAMRYLALTYEKISRFVEAIEVWKSIASSTEDDSQSKGVSEHIIKNLAPTERRPIRPNTERNHFPFSRKIVQKVMSARKKERAVRISNSPVVSDMDSNIPMAREQRPNAVALILSISRYGSADIPEVKYATIDAEVVRQYLVEAMGFKVENILPIKSSEQFTLGRIQSYIKSILPSYLKPDGSSDLFIYFTGHGAPSTTSHEAYLVPWDCDPNHVNDDNAYSMKRFYTDIEKLKARQKMIVVDACFSGYTGSGGVLLRSASPLYLRVNNPLIADSNTVIFQSSSADEVSNWYDEKRHGMFTYFFLKGLQGAADYNHDGAITAHELMKYINDQNDGLPYWSNRLYQRPQEAQLEGNGQTVIVRTSHSGRE